MIPTDKKLLKEHIIKNGSFSSKENERIFINYFETAPRYIFRAVDKKYQITDKILADVGCAFGMNLPHCSKGSYGIEVDQKKVEFAQKLGLKIYSIDIGKEDIALLPKVEVIWCSHVVEHVNSPHIFLRKLHQLLKPGGLVVIFVPTIPLAPVLQHVPVLGKLVRGFDVDDHVNAYIPKTLQFFCERAGFKTIEVSPFYPGILTIFNKLPFFNRFVSRCTYIGQKIDNWEYPPEATRRTEKSVNGFRFK